MNDPTPLHDDGIDEGLRAALLQIDRGPELTVDVDEVLRRGARHRRLVALERAGAVAAVALVVVGAGSFALTRTTPQSAPVAPGTSVAPTRSVDGAAAPSMVDGSSGVTGDPKLRRGVAAFEISNTGTETTTVSLGEITASGAPLKAVLVALPPTTQHGLTIDDELLSSVDRPGPASVTVPAGQHAILVMSVTVPTCPSSLAGVNDLADTISSNVTLDLRTASGGTGTLNVTQADGPGVGWVRTGLWYACGFPPKS